LLKEIIISIQAYFKAHQFIKKHKLWLWIFLPGLVYTLLMIVSYIFFSKQATHFLEVITLKMGLKDWLQRMQSGWLGFIFTFSLMIVWVIQMLLFISIFKFLFLIVGSPVFSYLSEKTESIIQGKEFSFSFLQLLKDIFRGVKIAIRNAGWQTVYMFSIFVLSFIPIVGCFTVLIAVLIECYYYGFSMLDYSMERHKKSATESIFFIAHHKGLAVGNGLVFYCLHLIPILGWLVAPAYAVVAATISLDEFNKSSTNMNSN
jgi:CysZ protein